MFVKSESKLVKTMFSSLSLSIYISFVPPNVFHELCWRRDQSKVKFPL